MLTWFHLEIGKEDLVLTGITDIHCHLLPGLDDGSQSMEETIAALKEAKRQNIHAMIMTPHYFPEYYTPERRQIRQTLAAVRDECMRHQINIHLYPGQECYYYSGLVEKLKSGEVLTLAESNYVLVEFDPGCTFSYMRFGLQELQNAGYRPILAHFERYECLTNEANLITLKRRGIMLQMNFSRLQMRDTLFRKNPWRKLMQEDIVDFLGSDTHGTHFRPLHVSDTYRWLETGLSTEQQHRILETNIKKIIMRE